MVDGVVVPLPRGLARSLVMSLVVDIDRTVTDEDLIERLWGGAAPANAHFSLRNTVSRLRSLLGHDVIERDEVGYRIPSSAVRTDLSDLDRHVAAGDVETALGLVRGPAFAAVRHEHWALRAVADADERVAGAEELWADQRLASGRLGSELGRVRAQALDKPMRETRWRQLVDALVLEARRAEALRAAHDARQALAQYGMVAGADLRAAEQRALADPGEDRPVGTPGAMSLEAARAWPIVGRDEVVRALSNRAFDRVISWVGGSIGVGVSRVLAEVAAMAREQGALVCAVDVEAAGRGQRTLAALGAELRAARLLAMPGSEASVDASISSPMPEVREGRLRSELVRDLVDLADLRPLVLVLDDVHLLTTADAAAVAHLVATVVARSLPVAFVCGEETALLSSLEGDRGQPRIRPPFPAVAGLYAKPTVVNNVETLSTLPHILTMGGAEYAKLGVNRSTGTRIFSVSGHVNRPGNYEVELGITFRDLIESPELGGGVRNGGRVKFLIPGGASSQWLTGSDEHLDAPLDMDFVQQNFGVMLGSGAVMVYDETTNPALVAWRLAKFFAHESCGKCTPCREGTGWIEKVLYRISHGHGRPQDLDLLLDVGDNISPGLNAPFSQTTICPLGPSAVSAVVSLQKYFRDEVLAMCRGAA